MNSEEVKNEVLRRMEVLGLKCKELAPYDTYNHYKRTEEVWKSEQVNPFMAGILYSLDEDEQAKVKEFEDEHKGLKVYHCIKNYTEFGAMLSLLFVNTRDDEFEEDKASFDEDIKDKYCFAYVCNLDDEFCSEFGSIVIDKANGGLKRIG